MAKFAREFLPILTVLATVFRRNIWYSLSLCSSLVCFAFYLANVEVTLENFCAFDCRIGYRDEWTLTFMLRYTPEELLAVRRYDVTPPRAVRKTII